MKSNKIVIMGGTFDPIHMGHLIAAERVREELGVDFLYFVPSSIPPHKHNPEMASAEDRYEMTRIAVSSNPFFKLSDIELKRLGQSYTIDTICEFKKEFGQASKIYFIIGTDNVGQVANWKEANKLKEVSEFIVVTRPGELEESIKSDLEKARLQGYEMTVLQVPLIELSSTEIRDRVKRGLSIKYLVPEEVREYIDCMGLYR
jgi:nicotinate-nucleotide adenylyltransferase